VRWSDTFHCWVRSVFFGVDSSLVALLFPHLAGLEVTQVDRDGDQVAVTAATKDLRDFLPELRHRLRPPGPPRRR
jgi:hypothetical protein